MRRCKKNQESKMNKKRKENLEKPLIMAHAGGMDHGKENSPEAVKKSLEYHPDIIELDIRKSADNILFCYHGFGIFVYFLAYFLRYFKHSNIKKIFGIKSELKEILDLIKEPLIVYLNLKDGRITPQEIDALHDKYPHIEFWIGMSNGKKIAELKQKLKYKYEFHSTWPNIFSFENALANSLKNDLHSVKLLPWQCNKQNLELIKKHGLTHILEPIFVTNKGFAKLSKKWGTLYICLNDLSKPHDVTSIYKDL